MAHKNLINGMAPINMLAIGKIIKKMALVFNTIQTAINIRVDGAKIKGMDRELFGLQIPKINWGDNTQVIGKATLNKGEELCFLKMEIDMMVCGWIICHMDKEEWSIRTVMFMKECGIWEKEVAMEF